MTQEQRDLLNQAKIRFPIGAKCKNRYAEFTILKGDYHLEQDTSQIVCSCSLGTYSIYTRQNDDSFQWATIEEYPKDYIKPEQDYSIYN